MTPFVGGRALVAGRTSRQPDGQVVARPIWSFDRQHNSSKGGPTLTRADQHSPATIPFVLASCIAPILVAPRILSQNGVATARVSHSAAAANCSITDQRAIPGVLAVRHEFTSRP